MKATHPSSEEEFLQKFRKLPEDRKSQVIDFIDFLSKKRPAPAGGGDAYGRGLEALRMKIRETGGMIAGRSKDRLIKKLRVTRESLWKEGYADHFGQQ